MNRREFVSKTGWIVSGAMLVPVLFSGCKPSDFFSGTTEGEVIIIGAGASGLYAGELLIRQGVKVKILEATSRWGGRLRSVPAADQSGIEKRIVHGQFSVLYDLLKHNGLNMQAPQLQEMFYFNGRLNTTAEAVANTFFLETLNAVASFEAYEGADIPALEYYQALGLSDNTSHVFNVLTGQVNGTSADRISGVGLRKQYELRTSGPNDYEISTAMLEQAMASVLPNAVKSVSFNSIVSSIDYSGNKIALVTTGGESYACDKLLITVPTDVLKGGSIAFSPALPAAHLAAVHAIGIDHAYAALLKVENPIWPAGATRIYGPGAMQRFDVRDDGWVYAEASGKQADDIAAIFGDPALIIAEELGNVLGVESIALSESAVQYWSGNRSYDKPGTANARSALAESVAGKLFFAGEATHMGGHHGTMHGAMETGLRAANEIITALRT